MCARRHQTTCSQLRTHARESSLLTSALMTAALLPLCLSVCCCCRCRQMFRVVFNTVFIWKIDTELWIWKVGVLGWA